MNRELEKRYNDIMTMIDEVLPVGESEKIDTFVGEIEDFLTDLIYEIDELEGVVKMYEDNYTCTM